MTTEEGNKLIAVFMGTIIGENKYKIDTLPFNGITDLTGLWYHTSWDWLMPVVEKIEHTGKAEIQIKRNLCLISYNKNDWAGRILQGVGRNEPYSNEETIKCIWLAVIQFIQWHNQNL